MMLWLLPRLGEFKRAHPRLELRLDVNYGEVEIAAGHLVAPLGFVAGPNSLELWTAEHLRARPDVDALLAWPRSAMRSQAAARPTPGDHPLAR